MMYEQGINNLAKFRYFDAINAFNKSIKNTTGAESKICLVNLIASLIETKKKLAYSILNIDFTDVEENIMTSFSKIKTLSDSSETDEMLIYNILLFCIHNNFFKNFDKDEKLFTNQTLKNNSRIKMFEQFDFSDDLIQNSDYKMALSDKLNSIVDNGDTNQLYVYILKLIMTYYIGKIDKKTMEIYVKSFLFLICNHSQIKKEKKTELLSLIVFLRRLLSYMFLFQNESEYVPHISLSANSYLRTPIPPNILLEGIENQKFVIHTHRNDIQTQIFTLGNQKIFLSDGFDILDDEERKTLIDQISKSLASISCEIVGNKSLFVFFKLFYQIFYQSLFLKNSDLTLDYESIKFHKIYQALVEFASKKKVKLSQIIDEKSIFLFCQLMYKKYITDRKLNANLSIHVILLAISFGNDHFNKETNDFLEVLKLKKKTMLIRNKIVDLLTNHNFFFENKSKKFDLKNTEKFEEYIALNENRMFESTTLINVDQLYSNLDYQNLRDRRKKRIESN